MKTKFERFIETLSHFIIIAGIVFAALQYWKNSRQHAFDSSQSYVLHRNIERLYDARVEAFDGIFANSLNFQNEINQKAYEAFNKIRLAEQGKDSIQFDIAVLSLVQFYDAVGQCYLDASPNVFRKTIGLDETCDRNILSKNFVSTINQVLGYHGTTIEKLRPIFPGLGESACAFLRENPIKDKSLPGICNEAGVQTSAAG